jgi:CheY-like chemotaxis protein
MSFQRKKCLRIRDASRHTESEPRVLVVDDDCFLQMRFAQTLEEGGVETTMATSGQEALEQFRSVLSDLVVLDLIMPGLDGFGTCSEIPPRLKAGTFDV